MFESGSKADTALKLLCMGAGGYLVAYMVGPLSGHVAQSLYRQGFYFLYGTPSPWWWWLDPNQWRGWMNEGHIFYYAYQYGDKACGTLAAPFFYNLPDLVRYIFTRKKPVNPQDRAVLEKELEGFQQLGKLLQQAPEVAGQGLLDIGDVIKPLLVERERELKASLEVISIGLPAPTKAAVQKLKPE